MIDLIQVTTRSILLLSFDSGYISITESISAIIEMENKIKSFNGQGNLTEFVTKVELHSALKGFTGEKKAQNLASRLEGPAFDVYLRLSAEERKDFDQIKGELLKEFEKGQLNREEAIFELSNRNRLQGESALTYSYKIMELIKLAYPGFDDSARAILAKDYFVRGLHPDMRSALKAMEKFQSCDVKALAAETVRLELAGVKSNMTIAKCHSANAISIDSGDEQIHPTVIDKIADKVVEKLNAMTTDDQSGGNNSSASGVNYTSNQPFHRGRGTPFGRRFQNRNRGQGRGSRFTGNFRGNNTPSQQNKCRSCKSVDHFVASCPTRFCQACGQQGHDSWNPSCPNYQ